jgi:predicted negative regulator of RcsB-dependent stress response
VDDYLTNEQQVELVKKLWKEYGIAITLGALIAMTVSVGWRFYQRYNTRKSEQASLIYERMASDVMQHQITDAKTQSDILIHKFSKTPYATLASFTLAKLAVEQNQLDEAVQHLNWIIQHSHNKDFKQIARIRLARVYLSQNETKKALQTLEQVDSFAFQGLIAEVRGDVYTHLGQIDKARNIYQEALKQLPEQTTIRPLLQMKLDNLPQTNT